MLEDEEDFGNTSIADAATRDSASSSSTPILYIYIYIYIYVCVCVCACVYRLKPISSNGNGEVPLQSN